MIFIALIGAMYYLLVGRAKAFAPVTAPSPEDDDAAGRTGLAPRRLTVTARAPVAWQPPRIVREPGTTVHAQIEDWLAGRSRPARWRPATGCRPSTTWPRGSGSAG